MPRRVKSTKRNPASKAGAGISLADQLFVATTMRYTNPEAEFLPAMPKARMAAMGRWRNDNQPALERLRKELQPTSGRRIQGKFGQHIILRWVVRAALFLFAISGGLYLFTNVLDDTIRIEDELGKSAMGSEFGAQGRTVQLRFMRKRRKIGEITVAEGSRLKVVRTSNGDAFRSEVAFTGTEADFKLKYKGRASVIVKNGPFEAKVRIQAPTEKDVHLRFREIGTLMPIGEPQFAIEVLKGDVQIAEKDDGDNFEPYKEGEKAVFSLDGSESL